MSDTLDAPTTAKCAKTPRTRKRAGHLAQFLPYQLSIASNAVSDLIAERYRERFGLKILEWRVMAVLGDHAESGLTQRALTEAILTDKVAINRACKVLEGRGLIARVPNASDGRSHLMKLTKEGRSIHSEVLPIALKTERELLADFSEPEQAQLRDLLERLRSKVDTLG
ncbi:MAG: MarR family transcriptional regulator [Erythrobacter sp.]|nr:MarR family transcriptional regulator [Erythrobacter sp.]